VESGSKALIQVNGIECAVTPTVIKGGQVALRAVVTQPHGSDATPLAVPQITTDLGKAAEFKIGRINFAVACTLED
jgi:hypothetical protein